jgi:drug/metabolite transporter (DMT)-like permease
MIAFAANSLLCREALRGGSIDAASFTAVRTASGAAVLMLLLVLRDRRWALGGSLPMTAMLFLYMIAFSLAYLSLGAATGALLLFGAVQLTMFTRALASGERLSGTAWIGLVLAVSGLVILLLPGVTAPAPVGAALMIVAGMAWGVYSLLGRSAGDPLITTAGNFLRATPAALLALWLVPLLGGAPLNMNGRGLLLAVASGALASGLGYVIWYAALRGLTASRAATVQLSVPMLAALGGALLLGEALTPRLLLATFVTIGGVWLVLAQRAPGG